MLRSNKKMNVRTAATLLLLSTSLPAAPLAFADLAIIVHPSNNSTLTSRDVRKIFLGKSKSFSNGKVCQAIELSQGNKDRDDFLNKVLRKSESTLNSHWARMLFSSKAKPPKSVSNALEMKSEVANNPNAIGYIDAKLVDSSVKAILSID